MRFRVPVCAAGVGVFVAIVVLHAQLTSAADITVPAGGDLQAALNTAQAGDTILLAPGATYVGNFVLPVHPGAGVVTVRSGAADTLLPAPGTRMTPAAAAYLPKLKSPNSDPVIATVPGASYWRLVLLELQANAQGIGDIMTLGDGSGAQSVLAQVPHHLFVDRVYMHGDATLGQKRGIALNSAATDITNSYIADIKAVGQDSQAIAGWNGPGPYTIRNNYLEAAGENLMFGGADPSISNLVPSDILVDGNTISKPLAWRSEAWSVKNGLELKNARRVTIWHNVIEGNWLAAQAGYAILFTPRNQSGTCPWCTVEDVLFERNVVRQVSSAINILGTDNEQPSQQAKRITIRNNLITTDRTTFGGDGRCLLIGGAVDTLVFDHNTCIADGPSTVYSYGSPSVGFVFTNNLLTHDLYGFFGDGVGIGTPAVTTYFPGALFQMNAFGDGIGQVYPVTTLLPALAEFQAQFVDYANGNFALASASAWKQAGTDGLDLGVVPDGTQSDPPPSEPPPPDVPANVAPTVSVVQPIDRTVIKRGTSVDVTASADDADGWVTRVDFYVDGVSIGSSAGPTFSATWIATMGGHTIYAVAVDDKGATTTSKTINVSVKRLHSR
jgi:hypothetical protein